MNFSFNLLWVLACFFIDAGYSSMELVKNGKEHALAYVVIDNLHKLPVPDALSYSVVTTIT